MKLAARRRVLGVAIVLVLGGDGSAVAARWGGSPAAGSPVGSVAVAAATTTTTVSVAADRVLFRERFDPGSAYAVGDETDATKSIVDGEYRLKLKRPLDIYVWVPKALPEHAVIAATRDLRVEVDARSTSTDPTDSFGLMCRSGPIDGDAYVAQVRPDGSWALIRATLGSGHGLDYVKRVLAHGKAEGMSGVQPMPAPVHVSLQCRGDSPASLVLRINGEYAGQASDPTGLGPGDAGFVGSSTLGEVAFDNLVVTALR